MTRILINFVLIFIIVSYELMTVWSKNNTLDKTWSLKNITHALKEMDLIQLIDFQQPILIEQNEIDNNNGTLRCETFKTIKNIKPKMYKGVGDMQCYGWVDSCQSIRDDITRRKPAVYCFSDHYKRLTWVRDTNYHQYGYENRRCRRIKLESDEAIKSKKDYISNACLCKCTRKSDNPKLNTTNWAFSLQPQISDIENNKVVTGVRIANHSKIIHLEIKESRIGSYKDDSWKSPGSLEGLIRDVDYSFLQPDSRSINLDKIVVPADYVVTGVKFIKIRSTYAAGQEWTLRLEVQGTKFDVAARKLLKNTSTWFNSDTSAAPLKYYGQNRSRIFMERWDPLSPVHNDDKKCIPNTYIKFTTTKLNEDLGRFTIPYMSTRPVELKTNRFLSGISLLYKGKSGYVGYIAPGIHLNLNITFENNTTDIIMAKENKTEFFMNKDVEDVTIPNENQIESGFPNDKKIAGSRMENITINTTTEESIGKGYTIDESRIQLTTEKTNGANENSIDAKNEQGNTMKAKETLEPNTTEVVVGERNMRDGQNTASILTRESMKNKFPTIGSTESSIKDEYSEINGTKEIMSIVNAIEENIKERNTLEITTGKENLLQKSVFETNTTGATIGKGNTTHAEFIKVNPLGTTNKNESITKANSPAKVITAGISISEGQTTESVALKRSMRHKLHENESPENIILDAYSDKKTTVKTLSAGNAIEAITENESTTIVAQLESTTAGKILSEMSVKERNKMEVISEEQNMILARAIVIPSTSEATTERSSMTEEQTKTPTTTDRSVQEEIYESESSDINMTDEYLENDTTEEIMKAGNTIEPTTENDSVTITGQSESTTAEISADISLKGKNEMETTSKERNMLLAGATVEPSMTETSTEESRITEGKTTTITTTDRSMQEEIYKSESSDINMIDAHSEKSTTEEIMKVGNTIEPTTENESVTITGQFESTTAEKILLEMSVKERNKMEVTTEIQNMILVGPTVKPSMTETTPERNSMIEGQTIGSTTTDRSMQEEIYKSESSDINMTDEYLENDTTEEIMKAENTIEPTTENESVTITGQSESTTAEISADISLKEKNEMETTSKEQNMWLAGATVEASMTETSTEESRITEGQTMTITTTDRSMQKEIYKSESSDINMTNGYLENDTSEEIMEVAYSTEPTTEYQSATVGTQSEPTITEMSADISLEEKNIMETTSEEQNIILTGAFVKPSTTETSTEESRITEGQTITITTTDRSMQEEIYKSESSDINMTNGYLENDISEEIMEAENAIKPTTEHLSVTIATQSESTTTEISVDISLKEKNETEATTEKQNKILAGATVKPSVTEATTERSSMIEGQDITSTTTVRSMQEEIYKSEPSDINMIDAYLEKNTTEEIMKAENTIVPTTENESVTITGQSESTTAEKILLEMSVEETNKMEVTTEKQNMILIGPTVKPSTTEATPERNSMIEGKTIVSTTTDRSTQEEIYKSESSDINMTDGYLENDTSEEIMEAENAIKPTTENLSVTIATQLKSTTPKISVDISLEEKNIMEATSEEQNIMLTGTFVKPSTTETSTEESRITEGQTITITTTDRSMQEEIYKSESSDINMTNGYLENDTSEEIMEAENAIKPTTENLSVTIATQSESTTTEISVDISLEEKNQTEATTEKQNKILAGATVKPSVTEATTERSSMIEGQTITSTTTVRSMQEEIYKSESSDINMIDGYLEKNTTEEITEAGNAIEPTTEYQRVTITEKSTNNIITETTGVRKALIEEYEIDSNTSESTLGEETSTNEIMSKENTVKDPDEEETSTKVVIEETTVMVPKIMTPNTLETITDEKNVTEGQSMASTITNQSMGNELYTSESSDIRMLDAYSEKNKTAEFTLLGDTIETMTKNHNITIASQTKSITVTEIPSEESVKERNKTETITEIAKTSTLDTNAEVEHMKEAQNLEANVVGKVRIDKFPKYVLKERPSVPTIENESMTDTIEKEGMIVTEKKLTEKIINETITAKENTAVPQSTNFNMTKEADTMNEFLISLSESSATEAISQNELMIEKSTNDIIAEDESILVASPTTNNTMADKIIQKESIINLRTAGMNTIKAISDEKTITEKQTIDAITTERSLKNELQTSGSSEINENTIKPTTKIENIAIKTQSSNNSITDKTTEKTIMQNDEPAMDNSILESIATTGSITEKTTIVKNRKGLEIMLGENITGHFSMLKRCRTGKRWQNSQNNSANILHVQIIHHIIILLSIILVL